MYIHIHSIKYEHKLDLLIVNELLHNVFCIAIQSHVRVVGTALDGLEDHAKIIFRCFIICQLVYWDMFQIQ